MKTFKLNQWRTFLSLGCAFGLLLGMKAEAAEQAMIRLQQPHGVVAQSDAVQHFNGDIDVGKGQDRLPLTLTYSNGSATTPSFRWLRISSPSMSYITGTSVCRAKESVD